MPVVLAFPASCGPCHQRNVLSTADIPSGHGQLCSAPVRRRTYTLWRQLSSELQSWPLVAPHQTRHRSVPCPVAPLSAAARYYLCTMFRRPRQRIAAAAAGLISESLSSEDPNQASDLCPGPSPGRGPGPDPSPAAAPVLYSYGVYRPPAACGRRAGRSLSRLFWPISVSRQRPCDIAR